MTLQIRVEIKKSIRKKFNSLLFFSEKIIFLMLKNPTNRDKPNKKTVRFWCNEIGNIEYNGKEKTKHIIKKI